LLVAAALAGCGDRGAITAGGEVPGDTVTVYVLVPYTRDGRNLVRGAKLALAQAGGRAGELTVQFASQPEPADTEGIASAVRDVVHDTGTIAVIGDLDERTAAVSGPLLNAVGLLHLAPGGTYRPEQPARWRTFFPVGATPEAQAVAIVRDTRPPYAVEFEPGGEALAGAVNSRAGGTVPTRRARTVIYAGTDRANARGVIAAIRRENPHARIVGPWDLVAAPPPGFARAFPGVRPGIAARTGYDAMNAVLAALRRAGARARSRQAVIDAFRTPPATPLSVRG
jgi:ABC-type branched-subunit amino acid transport system substrate-binding protein